MRASHQTNFLDIAIDEYLIFEQQLTDLTAFKKEGSVTIETETKNERFEREVYYNINEILELESKIEKTCIKIIIFLATYLESYIWDYAANRLGERYVEKHLDKLSIISKWEIIPLLVTKKPLIMKAHQLAIFKSIIIERNKLIHHKSINLTPYIGVLTSKSSYPNDLIYFWERLNISSFFAFIKHLLSEFDKIDPQGHHKTYNSVLENLGD
jgi:hypothetical protein